MNFGPFSYPPGVLVTFVAVVLTLQAGRAATPPPLRGAVERWLWICIAAALAAGRLAFVLRHHDAYLAAPLTILDLRDGGFAPLPALAAGVLAGLASGWRRAAARKPLLAGLCAGLLAAGAGLLLTAPPPARTLPALRLQDADGHAVDLAALAGRPVVVNLWASWCPPCRREMPLLVQAARAEPRVRFLFVDQGEAKAEARAFAAQQGLAPDQLLFDPDGRLGRAIGSRALPTTLFVDARGRLVDQRLGELSAATLDEHMAPLRTP